MRFHARFIGAFALEDAQGRDVLPPLRKTRALLARILLARGEALPRSALIQFAWRDREAEQGRASLRQALYEARGLTQGRQPLIHVSRTAVRANLAVLDSDFDRLIAATRIDDLAAPELALGPGLPLLLADLDGISPTIDGWLAAVRLEKQVELAEAVSAAASHARGGGPTLGGRGRIRLAAGVAVVLLTASVAAAWWLRPGAPHRVLAVEPLRAAAGDAPAQAVSLGLSGDLAHALVANPARIVIDQIGQPGVRAFNADLIVSGAVATLGDRLQAHVQLASARGGAILWANDFVGDPGHPDVVREQIATKADAVINCALSTRHGGAARISDEANRLSLKACDLIEQYRLDEALPPLRQVTVLEPGFARAWADLATTEVLTAASSDPVRRAAAFREGVGDAGRALALDPGTGLAYYALANSMPGIANWRRRVEVIAAGLRFEPDGSELNNAMAKELLRVGRSSEAITYYRRSVAADPLNPVKTACLITALAFDGQLDEAESLIDRALRLWPRNTVIWQRAFGVELQIGDPRRAEAMLDAPDRPGARDPTAAAAYRQWLRLRLNPTARSVAAEVARLVAAADPGEDRLPAAIRLARLGQTEAAYRLALGGTGAMDEANDWLLFAADLTRFQKDPRFMTLAARRGLTPIWRATGAWPDFCAASRRQACGPTGPIDRTVATAGEHPR